MVEKILPNIYLINFWLKSFKLIGFTSNSFQIGLPVTRASKKIPKIE